MKNITNFFATLIIAAVLGLASCAGSGKAISDTSWKLVSYGPAASPTAAAQSENNLLTFGSDGRLTGSVGCNRFSGTFKVSGDQVSFGEMASTLMACPDPVIQQETAVLQVFSGTAKFSLEAGKLVVSTADGATTLTFEQVTPK